MLGRLRKQLKGFNFLTPPPAIQTLVQICCIVLTYCRFVVQYSVLYKKIHIK